MVLNTLTVGAAVTPTVIKTYGSHYLNRKPRQQKPTAHISYDEGLHLIRKFLLHASHHTVEELQAFTAQWVPSPRWVRTEDVTVPEATLARAADVLVAQLGHKGVDRVGGKTWWQWRRNDKPLKAEWVEMRADYNRRKKADEPCTRVMLYVHGGAYYFGSVDEHRYQMQRHARKLKARVFAPRYRLAPQYPFPCGLQDCLAAYLHLLTIQDPSTILLAGDSAGGGMIVSLMVTMRDQGIPLPAGAILISPWVDQTHSFPSLAGSGDRDYIPETGFFHKPSAAWPPPNADDMREMSMNMVKQLASAELPRKSTHQERDRATEDAIRGFSVTPTTPHLMVEHATPSASPRKSTSSWRDYSPLPRKSTSSRPDMSAGNALPEPSHTPSVEIDGVRVEIKDQIQMYATNDLITHPMVSPVLQPSLGGLPPMLIQVGGGEMLRDEQIYLAHKAANPTKYPPPDFVRRDIPNAAEIVSKYKPTDVQLQVWDDLCHVAPTLSFTRPAKYMYRSIAQFGAWALAHAQRTEIDILDDDDVSVISTGSDTGSESDGQRQKSKASEQHTGVYEPAGDVVGKAGDPLPPFKAHMVRQRIDRHGEIHPLGRPDDLEAMQMDRNEIGVIKAVTVKKWLATKKDCDEKYAREKRAVQKQRIREMTKGYRNFGNDEVPPPSALAGRILKDLPEERRNKRSLGMSLWSLWGSSHDKETIDREEHHPRDPEVTITSPTHSTRRKSKPLRVRSPAEIARSRSRSHVRDMGQTNEQVEDENTMAAEILQRRAMNGAADRTTINPQFVPLHAPPTKTRNTEKELPMLVLPGTNVTLDGPAAMRPKADGIAFPFKLSPGLQDSERNASMVTLQSEKVNTPGVEAGAEKQLGYGGAGAVCTCNSPARSMPPQMRRPGFF